MAADFVILLVEDNPADVRLTQEALRNGRVGHELHVVTDGVQALAFLRNEGLYAAAPQPDLILLDLNLPRKNGHEVLVEIKSDPTLMRIPVIILSTSQADDDVLESYNAYANGYIVKPADVEQFFAIIKNIKNYWMSIVVLPPKNSKRPQISAWSET
jgi:chemotaxis family two-component system response regulator Rcp1